MVSFFVLFLLPQATVREKDLKEQLDTMALKKVDDKIIAT